ncbi:uncharacterized protein [Polyergus mexicanus]|uniref:uncharacterized protein n=1 Tax=Polyergus mexicanus TaxID=615972 RepID=UPI0038B52508
MPRRSRDISTLENYRGAMNRVPNILTRLAGRVVNIRIRSIEDIQNLEILNCLKKELREYYIEDCLYCTEKIGFAEEFVRQASEARFDEPFANVGADGYLFYCNWKRRYGIPRFLWELNHVVPCFYKYNPMRAGCRVKIPREIMLKKAVVNVQSTDNACFAWAIVAALYPVEKHTERSSRYPHYSTVLNLEGVEFPMSLNGITKFEPIRDNTAHFAWIKNLSRFIGSQLSCGKHKTHICDRAPFPILSTNDDKWLEFHNYDRKEKLPFMVYADLECVLEKKEEKRTSNTSIVQHHKFVKELYDIALRVRTILDTDVPITNFTSDKWERFMSAMHCHVCERPLELEDARVRNHCHLTGRYRDPAHSNCNLNYKKTYVIPVFFHNLSGYEAHFIIRDVAHTFPVFLYEYIDDVDKLLETRLPPREASHSSLTGNAISENDYARVIRVWERFRVKTLGDYSDLYLKTDGLLLADVFENFRDACMRSYNLDPAYYYTLPGYTWDAMLKYTSIRFELLIDIDMSYDPSEPLSYLMYFDINNLYGWAMCQSLPYKNFQWVDDVTSIDLMSVTSNSPIGYILEVDLAYSSDLHDSHADLPFCQMRDKPPGKREEKLLAMLYDKSRYVIYYRNLQQCVRHGLRLARIHRIMQFAQSPWLCRYIELNTRL